MAARRKNSRLSAFKTGAVFLDLKLLQDVVLEFNKNFSAQQDFFVHLMPSIFMHAVVSAMYIYSVRVVPCKQRLCSLITHYNSILYIPIHAPNLSRLWTTLAFPLVLHYEPQWLNLCSIKSQQNAENT